MHATFLTRLEALDDEDEVWLSKAEQVPFIPMLGIMFRPNRSDDFMTIEDVYYCGETGMLEVHLSPQAGTLGALLSRDWVLEES